MTGESGPIEVTGYLTAMSAVGGGRPELYLHGRDRTFRIAAEDARLPEGTDSPAGLPLGPGHRVRVVGRLTGDPLLPVLRAERMELDP